MGARIQIKEGIGSNSVRGEQKDEGREKELSRWRERLAQVGHDGSEGET